VTAVDLAAALALGLIFGSFANVCIHRMPERRSVAWPGSACPQCGAPIAWFDNIPVLSWLVLRGRCRACHAPIPWSYPVVEATSALMLVQLCLRHGLTLRWVALSYLALSLLVLVPIDWKHGILPDLVTIPGTVVGLVLSFFTSEPGRVDAMLGAAVGGLVPLMIRAAYMAWARIRTFRVGGVRMPGWPGAAATTSGPTLTGAVEPVAGPEPTPATRQESPGGEGEGDEGAGDEPGDDDERREGLGLGDVKMLMMVGAFLGVSNVLLTMLLGSVIGSLYVVPLVLVGRRSMKSAVPFGPFLGIAAILSMFWGRQIIDWYTTLVLALPLGGS